MCEPQFLPFTPLNGHLIKSFAIFLKRTFFGTPCRKILFCVGRSCCCCYYSCKDTLCPFRNRIFEAEVDSFEETNLENFSQYLISMYGMSFLGHIMAHLIEHKLYGLGSFSWKLKYSKKSLVEVCALSLMILITSQTQFIFQKSAVINLIWTAKSNMWKSLHCIIS